MSLTIKHLNNDTSFLLVFEPLHQAGNSTGDSPNRFTILIDPWLSGTSKIWHSKFSISKQKVPPFVSSLAELPEPDLVIISQDKTDHCHEPTLKSLPSDGTKTRILAQASAARTIRSWKYFEPAKIVTLPKWEEIRSTPNPTLHRLSIPSPDPKGIDGEISVAYISQKHDITGLHSAIGITYRAPTSSAFSNPLANLPLTPPASPTSLSPATQNPTPSYAISVLYSPHGVSYKTLEPYVTSHLVSEAALPLTALLHCFDQVTNPWYLGGNICAGFPGGAEIAQKLLARCWISAHDGDKEVKGFASSKIMTKKFTREQVEEVVSPKSDKFPEQRTGPDVVVLDVGEEIRLS